MVLVLPDVFKSGKVKRAVLGSAVYVRRGPVTLALRAGAAVVPMCVTRDAEDRLTLRISPEIDLVKTGDLQGGCCCKSGPVYSSFGRHGAALSRSVVSAFTARNGKQKCPADAC